MSKLLSFHNDPSIKEKYLNRLHLHYKADEIIKGTYWQNGKGCAVGCTVHSSSHASYESELGIPRILARLEDTIFEGLPNEEAKEFPIRFLEAIPVGVDLDPVWRKFMIWLLVDENEGVIRHAKTAKTKKAIRDVAQTFSDSLTKTVSHEKWATVRRAAAAAGHPAGGTAAYAAYAAAYAGVLLGAAGGSFAVAAMSGALLLSRCRAARSRKYVVISEKLIELLKGA